MAEIKKQDFFFTPCNLERTKTMNTFSEEELLRWVVDYKYQEHPNGIGKCEAYISVRDEEERLMNTFYSLTREQKKELMCALIEKVGYPCEDYADDFDCTDSGFGFECTWSFERAAIHFSASFRV